MGIFTIEYSAKRVRQVNLVLGQVKADGSGGSPRDMTVVS